MTKFPAAKLTIVRSGLDALTYLQFLRLLRWLFFAICIFVALPLTGVNYYVNTRTAYGSGSNSPGSSASEAGSNNSTAGLLEDLTAANISGNVLYIHIVFVYIATVLVFFFGEFGDSHSSEKFFDNFQCRAIRISTSLL